MNIKLFLTDVDGCLTDGSMYYSAEGDAMKRFCVYDGLGLKLLQSAGIKCGIITGETTPIVEKRFNKLQLDYLFMGCKGPAKLEAARTMCTEMGISMQEVCYVGDDIIDVDLLSEVGYPACPPNARPEVKSLKGIKHLLTPGGQGAVREMCDEILKEIKK